MKHESKDILSRLKRTKVSIKDAIARAKAHVDKIVKSNIIRAWTEITKQARVTV